MIFSKEDKVIDWVIAKLKYGECVIIQQQHYKPDFEFETPRELDNILKLAEEYNLLDRRGKRTLMWLTQKGYEIQKRGGWLKHLDEEDVKKRKESERQSKLDEILDLDITLKKFESRMGKRIIIAGFVITLLSFLITLLTIKFFPIESENESKVPQIENNE